MPDLSQELNSFESILVERKDNIGIIRLNRPNALNALSSGLMRELLSALNALDSDSSIYCIIVTGNDKVFSAGADIKEMSAQSSISALKEGNLERWDSIAKIEKPIIAAVSGYCFGGGLELAMACDIIIAGENARLGQPEINIGVMPGAGGTQRLTRVLGKYIAMEMILTGREMTGREAFERGLVSRAVPDESYFREAIRVAKELCEKSPLALRVAKECVVKSYESTLSEGLRFEHKNFYLLMGSEDKQEGMKAFQEKRKPVFKGK